MSRIKLSVKTLVAVIALGQAIAAVADDGFEPPANPYLADSPWPMSHRTPYAQGSSPYPGPTGKWDLRLPQQQATGLTNITLAMSPRYFLGSRVYWGSTFGAVYKLRANGRGLDLIDHVDKPSGPSLSNLSNAVSGAYTLVDRDNTFFTVEGATVLAYGDKFKGLSSSPIELRAQFTLPDSVLRGGADQDPIVGLNILWDGRLALVTKRGTVAVVNRDLSSFQSVQLGNEEGEEVSNSIATDENGGIYVVTSEAMYRVQWTGSELSLAPETGAWRADYETGEDASGSGRLGAGSGATPSLMGTGDQDRFVVITDGQSVAHLVLFWRDQIPADWQPIAPGKDRRIAAEVPVNFGDPARTQTVSEQSVLVRGYGAVVVSNDYRNTGLIPKSTGDDALDNLSNGITVALSGFPLHQPYGVHKFKWDPESRELETEWVNTDISCPNGIPTMSSETQLFYCIGARSSAWTLEALNWNSGQSAFYKLLGWDPFLNSFYAGTQIGDGGRIVSGTTFGAMELNSR